MTQFLGAFRDDFYNAVNVLPQSQFVAITTALSATVLTAAQMSGAGDCYIVESGQTAAQTATTDTAANIIANLQNAVNTAWKGQTAFGSQTVVPAAGVPNLFNLTWTLTINNQNLTAGTLTLTAGTGVTLATAGTASATAITFSTFALYVCAVTGPAAVTFTRVQ
jgi:hypothetical protein